MYERETCRNIISRTENWFIFVILLLLNDDINISDRLIHVHLEKKATRFSN